MRRTFKTTLIMGIVLIIIAAGATAYWFVFKDHGFRLIETRPSQNTRTDTFSPTITLTFNRQIRTPDNFRISSTPAIDAEVYARGDTLYIVPHHALLRNQGYTISTSLLESRGGESLDEAKFSFRTGKSRSERLDFIRNLPVHNPGYSITYLEDYDTFVVRITRVPIEEKKLRARKFLRKNNIAPDQNNIEFDVLRSLNDRGAPAG